MVLKSNKKLILAIVTVVTAASAVAQSAFVGGLENTDTQEPIKIRNDVAQPSSPIVSQRCFKI